jgi:outer membrane protein OmpA-like peptidoglycan-associated protein
LTITGFADEVGDPEYNKRLSLARARAVASALPGFTVNVEGAGEVGDVGTDLTPEQRYYARSVKINVRAPHGEGAQGAGAAP